MSEADRQRRYRVRNPGKLKASRATYRRNNRTKTRKGARERERQRREEAKTALLRAVEGKCKRCGFDDARALVIDHVNDDGHLEDRRFRLNAVKYQRHVLAMLDSGRYQILCWNCNAIKEWERRRSARIHDEGPSLFDGNQHSPGRPEAAI